MATFDSTVRLRQLNQPELSGYIVLVAGGIPSTTGTLTGAFYPYKTNPSGYITTGQTGTFITQSALDSNYYSTLVYVADNYYPLSNPNGYVTSASLSGNAVLTTGDQNISGLKNFYTRPSVNGSGVQLQGEFLIDNAVYTTGDQTIDGIKTFIGTGIFNNNVGIKTTSPAYTLDVNGFINTNNGYKIYDTLNDFIWTLSYGDPYLSFDAPSSAGLLTLLNGNPGAVGINTYSPAYALDVYGTIGNSNGDLNINAGNNSAGGYNVVIQAGSSLGNNDGSVFIKGGGGTSQPQAGDVIIQGGNPADNGGACGNVSFVGGSSPNGISATPGNAYIQGGDSDQLIGAYPVTGANVIISAGLGGSGVPNGNIQLLRGKVGINTASPVYTLDVNGSGNFSSGLYINGIPVSTGSSVAISDVVYQTGNQTISGNKTFTGISYFKSGLFSSSLTISGVSVLTGVNTGSFITTGQTGSFATTGYVTGVSGYLRTLISNSSAGVTSLSVGSIAVSGTIILSGVNGLSIYTGTSNTIYFSGQSGNFVTTGQTGSFVTTGQTGTFITSGQTGVFVTTGQTGSFVTTSQTGNANTLNGQSGSYYLNYANMTGSIAGTGLFVTTGQTGSFVTTSQTGNANTLGGQSGSYYLNLANHTGSLAGTGSFITTGQTGVFVTTGQTGVFALSSQVVYTTGNQTISGTKTFTGIISVLSGNFTSSLTISGVPVSTGTSSSATISNVVYTTGNTTQTISGSLTVTGHFSANTKSFLIDHPIQSGKKLQYGVLEGPEHSVYLRGKTSSSFIQFPNYWSALVDINSVTVSLTPIAEYQKLFVQEINISGVKVGKNYFSDINYYYHIFAERKDVPKLDVEI